MRSLNRVMCGRVTRQRYLSARQHGEARAAVADDSVVTVGESRDEVVGVGGLGGGHHLLQHLLVT